MKNKFLSLLTLLVAIPMVGGLANSISVLNATSESSSLDPSKSFKDDFSSYSSYKDLASNYNNSFLNGTDYDSKAQYNNDDVFQVSNRFTYKTLLINSYNSYTSPSDEPGSVQTYLTLKDIKVENFKLKFKLYSTDYNWSSGSQFGLTFRKLTSYADTAGDDAYGCSLYLQYNSTTSASVIGRINAGGNGGRWEAVNSSQTLSINTEGWNDVEYDVYTVESTIKAYLYVNGKLGGYLSFSTNPELCTKGLVTLFSKHNYSYIKDINLTNNDVLPSEVNNFFDEFDNHSSYDSTSFREKWTNNYLLNKGTPAERAHNDTSRLAIATDPINSSNKCLQFISDGDSSTYITPKEYQIQNFSLTFSMLMPIGTTNGSWFGFMINKDFHRDEVFHKTDDNFIYMTNDSGNLSLSGWAYVNKTAMPAFTIDGAKSISAHLGSWVDMRIISKVVNNKQSISFYLNDECFGTVNSEYNIKPGFFSFINCGTNVMIDDVYLKADASSVIGLNEDFSYDSYSDMGVAWNNAYLANPSSSDPLAIANNTGTFSIVADPKDIDNNTCLKVDSVTNISTVGSQSYISMKSFYPREFDLEFDYMVDTNAPTNSWFGVNLHKEFRNDNAYYQQNGIMILLQENTSWSGTRFNSCFFEYGPDGRAEDIKGHNIPVNNQNDVTLTRNEWNHVEISTSISYNASIRCIDTKVTVKINNVSVGSISLANTVLASYGGVSFADDNYIGYIDNVSIVQNDKYRLDQISQMLDISTMDDIECYKGIDLVLPFDNQGVEVTSVAILPPTKVLEINEFSYEDGYLTIKKEVLNAYSAGEYRITIRTGDGIHVGRIVNATLTINQTATATLSFECNGGTPIAPITDFVGADLTEYTIETTKEGYEFAGWYQDSILQVPYTISTMPNDDKTIYAKWTPESYEITYLDQGDKTFSGTLDPNSPEYHIYDKDTILLNPTKTGYGFAGWYLDSACEGDRVYKLDKETYKDDIKVYAKWVSEEEARRINVRNFITNYMHPEISLEDHSDTGACRGADGYYNKAKTNYLKLSDEEKTLFVNDAEFKDYKLRFDAWAKANGEYLDGIVIKSANQAILNANYNESYIFLILSFAPAVALVLIILFKKKKSTKR